MRFLKILGGDFLHESRNERELEVVRSLGFSISIIGRKTENNHLFSIPNCDTKWMTVNPLFPYIKSKALNRATCLIPWAIQARKMKADVISCHDITYLFVGWLSTIGMRKKPCLIYDSHEYEYERIDNRSKVLRWFIKHLERFLMKKCVFSMMVNDVISDEVRKLHHLNERPIVVRNIPENWKIDDKEVQKTRKKFIFENNLPDNIFICMYHGVLSVGRGIELSMRTISRTNNTVLFILGNGDQSTVDEYKDLVKQYKIERRVFFHPAVKKDELYKYVGMADVGLVLIEPLCKSYYYSLPNKLFENIQSLTPVIASDFPEISKIVKKYDIGICVNPLKEGQVVTAIEKMQNDSTYLRKVRENVQKAKLELNWENERGVLVEQYQKILQNYG